MSGISVNVIDKDGYWVCTRTGDIESVMYAVDIEKTDFTMVAPPDILGGWRWVDKEWIADEATE